MNALSAAQAVQYAFAAGVRIMTDGSTLKLAAKHPPPAEILDALRSYKAEVIDHILKASPTWSAEDWQLYYEERAAIGEFEGELSRSEAECRAFACCISEWLNRHPEPSEPDRCAWCEKVDQSKHVVVPFGSGRSGHTWLHPECWTAWYEKQRQEARRALTDMSVGAPSYPTISQ